MKLLKWFTFLIILFFSLNVFADIEREGDGVLLDHWEEQNVDLPDDLKNLPSTPQEEISAINDNSEKELEEINPS